MRTHKTRNIDLTFKQEYLNSYGWGQQHPKVNRYIKSRETRSRAGDIILELFENQGGDYGYFNIYIRSDLYGNYQSKEGYTKSCKFFITNNIQGNMEKIVKIVDLFDETITKRTFNSIIRDIMDVPSKKAKKPRYLDSINYHSKKSYTNINLGLDTFERYT